ncbi:MAG: cytochrome c [Pyrinomonadaceae bacterium]
MGDKVSFVIERSSDDVVLTTITKIAGDKPSINGGELFAANCARCHGAAGEGTTKGIPLISGHALMHAEAEFIEQVNDGTENKMPAFREKLTAEEIAAVVKYVRTVIQAGFKHEEMKPHKH